MIHIIIPSGGKGLRFGGDIPKQYLPIDSIPIVVKTILQFEQIPIVSKIHIAAEESFIPQFEQWKKDYSLTKLTTIIKGGTERQLSIFEVLNHIEFVPDDIILVHDAVRPFVSRKLIENIIASTIENGATIPTLALTDTIKRKNSSNIVEETVDRSNLVSVQTPQGFTASILLKAYEESMKASYIGTDDSSLVERIGKKVLCIQGEATNIKITTIEDIAKAEYILANSTNKF